MKIHGFQIFSKIEKFVFFLAITKWYLEISTEFIYFMMFWYILIELICISSQVTAISDAIAGNYCRRFMLWFLYCMIVQFKLKKIFLQAKYPSTVFLVIRIFNIFSHNPLVRVIYHENWATCSIQYLRSFALWFQSPKFITSEATFISRIKGPIHTSLTNPQNSNFIKPQNAVPWSHFYVRWR